MSRTRLTAASTTLAIAAGALALGAPGAAAAKVLPTDINANPRAGHVKYGVATLKLSGGAASKLRSAGGKITGTGTAKVKGSTITADATESSLIDVTKMRGAIILDGGLTVKGRSKTAKLKAITLEPGIEKRVTAKIGSKSVELGSLKGGKTTFSRLADGTLKGAKLSLSGAGAKRLNAATGGGFSAGSFATVSAEITGTEMPIESGTAVMTLDPALLKVLTDAGYALSGEPPATVSGGTISIPLVAGAIDPAELTGRLSLEGKVTVGNGTSSIPLFAWRVALGGGQNELFANFNDGAAAILADVDVSQLAITLDGRNFKGVGGTLRLSKISTDILRQQFKVDLPAGTPMGTVALSGLLSGS